MKENAREAGIERDRAGMPCGGDFASTGANWSLGLPLEQEWLWMLRREVWAACGSRALKRAGSEG